MKVDPGLVVDLAALGIATALMLRLLARLDPRYSERSQAQKEGHKRLAARLSSLGEAVQQPLVLKEHEMEVAADVVCPDEIAVSFRDVGGLDEQAAQLQNAILLPLQRPDLFRHSRLLRPPKGILLHGPPGTGKTLLARAIAKEAKFAFINVNPARLYSKWYGESNKFAEAYFSLAHKLAPAILFIDEIDCLFGASRNQEHEATSMLKAQFLGLWDGLLAPSTASSSASLQVVVIAATNRPSQVDPAVVRRLPLSFQIDLPGAQSREEVLRLLLENEPLAAAVSLRELAAATDGYSGSDLDQLCKTAAMRPLEDLLAAEHAARPGASGTCDAEVAPATSDLSMRPLTLQDFLQAKRTVRPTRGRFSGTHHGCEAGGFDAEAAPIDGDLYD